jgi:hypothetical protein
MWRQKIVNSKKKIMNKLFGEKEIKEYLNNSFDILYKNEKTINLLSEEMFEKKIIPWLKNNIGDKLIYINCNNIVNGWEGNYLIKNKYGRPKNIGIISNYLKIASENIDCIIDLSQWNNQEIKKYTIDNMHLTYKGSEWIYNKIMKKLFHKNQKEI